MLAFAIQHTDHIVMPPDAKYQLRVLQHHAICKTDMPPHYDGSNKHVSFLYWMQRGKKLHSVLVTVNDPIIIIGM